MKSLSEYIKNKKKNYMQVKSQNGQHIVNIPIIEVKTLGKSIWSNSILDIFI